MSVPSVERMKMKNRIVTATIQFEFYPDEDELMIENNYSDEEMEEYYKELVVQDVTDMAIRYHEDLWNAIDIKIEG